MSTGFANTNLTFAIYVILVHVNLPFLPSLVKSTLKWFFLNHVLFPIWWLQFLCKLSFISPQKNLFSSTKKKKHCLPAFNAIFFNVRWRQVDNRIVNNLQKHWQNDILPFRSSHIKALALLYFQYIKTKVNLSKILTCKNVKTQGILFSLTSIVMTFVVLKTCYFIRRRKWKKMKVSIAVVVTNIFFVFVKLCYIEKSNFFFKFHRTTYEANSTYSG